MDIAAIIGAFGAMLAGFYALITNINKQSAADREADRQERQALANAFNRVADTNEGIKREQAKGNREAEQRNGHLAELVISGNDKITEAIKHIVKQDVKTQVVEHQTVNNDKQ